MEAVFTAAATLGVSDCVRNRFPSLARTNGSRNCERTFLPGVLCIGRLSPAKNLLGQSIDRQLCVRPYEGCGSEILKFRPTALISILQLFLFTYYAH
jgi:hypothetical protein